MDKTTIVAICIFIGVILIISFIPYIDIDSETRLNPYDYCDLTDINYTAVIRDDGFADITEFLTFDVHAAYKDNPYWELWRALPESEVDGLAVRYNVKSVDQVLFDGTLKKYDEASKLYWDDSDYIREPYGPNKWYHSKGPYNPSQRRYECLMFYVNGIYREKLKYKITYEMSNAALRYKDSSELYLSIFSDEDCKRLKSVEGHILFADENMPKEGNYNVYTLGTNSNSFPVTQSKTENPGYTTFSFKLDKDDLKFRSYNQFIEFLLISYNEDKYAFTKNAPKNNYSHEDSLDELIADIAEYQNLERKYAPIRIKAFIFFIAAAAIHVAIARYVINKEKTSRNYYKPTTTYKFFRDIPSHIDPVVANSIVFARDRKSNEKDIYSALLLDLSRKKYIAIEKINQNKEWTTSNTKIKLLFIPDKATVLYTDPNNPSNTVITYLYYVFDDIDSRLREKPNEPLTINEAHFFNLISRHALKGEIGMKEFQDRITIDYDRTNMFVTRVNDSKKDYPYKKGYYQSTKFTSGKDFLNGLSTYYIIAAIVVLVFYLLVFYNSELYLAYFSPFIFSATLIFTAIILRKKAREFVLFTQFGADEYEKWRGLYNYLSSETLINEKEPLDVSIWEEYLVYATAFGLSKKVSEALKIRCPEVIRNSSIVLRGNYYHSHGFRTTGRHIRTSAHHASSFSSGGFGGGHGGYGGGGRGGGGGGGGH